MKIVPIAMLALGVLVAGCSVRHETVRAAPPPTTQRITTVYSDPYSPTPVTTTPVTTTTVTTTTVTTPARY